MAGYGHGQTSRRHDGYELDLGVSRVRARVDGEGLAQSACLAFATAAMTENPCGASTWRWIWLAIRAAVQ